MSGHPNEVARRARVASFVFVAVFAWLTFSFFRTQVLQYSTFALQSEQNRLRQVPLPAPRGVIYDRNGKIIAENVPGFSVSLLSKGEDSLRASLQRMSELVPLSDDAVSRAVRQFTRSPAQPVSVLQDASFREVSVLEEHRANFPGLVIQSAPKRYYPDSTAVSAFVGYTTEISDEQLAAARYAEQGYKAGQQVGVSGLESAYESILRGREGTRFIEVDAHGRIVRESGVRPTLSAESGEALHTSIDIDLQRFIADSIFADSLTGGAIVLDPRDGGVLALHSAPVFNPNAFIGGISQAEYDEIRSHPRKPLYNKVIQGRYPPASTFKLVTAILGLEAGLVDLNSRMPDPCRGSMRFGNRVFHCWKTEGHGSLTLAEAIATSCNVYFYQLGEKLGIQNMIAGGANLGFGTRTGIDLPNEEEPFLPPSLEYYDQRFGRNGWTPLAAVLNLSIGQGEAWQTVANMAKFYTAIASDGRAVQPQIVLDTVVRQELFHLEPAQMLGVRSALANVLATGGTASSAALRGVVIAGKTGTAQNSDGADHAWFVGFAPADKPQVVVAVLVEFGLHGSFAARIASRIIARHLGQQTTMVIQTEG